MPPKDDREIARSKLMLADLKDPDLYKEAVKEKVSLWSTRILTATFRSLEEL